MKKLSDVHLKSMIKSELKKLVDEEILINPPQKPGDHRYAVYHDMLDDEYDEEDQALDYILENYGCGSKSNDYSLDSIHHGMAAPGEAVGIGFAIADAEHKGGHHQSSYMAKPQLAKIAKYAAALNSMISDGEELKDWQESKIAQMAQMIGDVYHSIEYSKNHHG